MIVSLWPRPREWWWATEVTPFFLNNLFLFCWGMSPAGERVENWRDKKNMKNRSQGKGPQMFPWSHLLIRKTGREWGYQHSRDRQKGIRVEERTFLREEGRILSSLWTGLYDVWDRRLAGRATLTRLNVQTLRAKFCSVCLNRTCIILGGSGNKAKECCVQRRIRHFLFVFLFGFAVYLRASRAALTCLKTSSTEPSALIFLTMPLLSYIAMTGSVAL